MNVLTAVGDISLGKTLKQKGFELCTYDIQYKEGIIEYLEVNNAIDYLIINYTLTGEMDNNTLIETIYNEIPLVTKDIFGNKLTKENISVKKVKDCFVLVGDKKGKLHVLDMDFKEKGKNDIHFGEYQVIKLSPDGKLIASGDNQRQILVYEADTKKVICDRFGFHTGSIFDLDWTRDSKFLASASLDGSVMLWEIETKKRLKNYPNFDGNQINEVRFMNDNKDVVCAGQSCNVKEIIFA